MLNYKGYAIEPFRTMYLIRALGIVVCSLADAAEYIDLIEVRS